MGFWEDNMIKVIRDTLFKNEELKSLMAIPDVDMNNLVAFRDKYFVRAVSSDALIIDEKVRVVYHEEEPSETDSNHIMKHRIYFDIYVRSDNVYTVTTNGLMHRGLLIADKINSLLSGKKIYNISFNGRGIFDQSSRAEGYKRVTVVFMYKRVYA